MVNPPPPSKPNNFPTILVGSVAAAAIVGLVLVSLFLRKRGKGLRSVPAQSKPVPSR
jgi:hypothetical protein